MKFEEFSIGDHYVTETVTVTKEEIIEFAEKYDPQYFHIDEEAAKESPYGSLIASGFHSLAVVWAEWVRKDILGSDCLGGVGAEIQWKAPVRPNDQLTGEFTVVDKKQASNGKRGLLTIDVVIKNQNEQKILTSNTDVFVAV
ncbi:MaoC/PaaZ C-terminal domain-containing protein [Shouchella shacheensis]|uniref:MaoC/PaaZ C-terminal domain-containing protein n=1 Tax=Shouchella shacheensis TaxID=1649580 RepID=UPI00073FD5CF|nr:MaoC/PaaZ C-terminal domain-containing protein [Shouchella shacheensis]